MKLAYRMLIMFVILIIVQLISKQINIWEISSEYQKLDLMSPIVGACVITFFQRERKTSKS